MTTNKNDTIKLEQDVDFEERRAKLQASMWSGDALANCIAMNNANNKSIEKNGYKSQEYSSIKSNKKDKK